MLNTKLKDIPDNRLKKSHPNAENHPHKPILFLVSQNQAHHSLDKTNLSLTF